MGIIKHSDIFNSKYITAEVEDSSKRIFFFHIKNVISDYWLADFENQLYCFKINPDRIKTYRHKGIKMFQLLSYTTSNVNAISAPHIEEIGKILSKNNLPRMNYFTWRLFKYLGKKEPAKLEDFKPHSIGQFFESISEDKSDQYREELLNLKNYLDQLGKTNADEIVTPVKRISDFIEDDLVEPDPRFYGSVTTQLKKVDHEHKIMTNKPITGKFPILKLMVILGIIMAVAVIGVVLYQSGALSHGLPGMPNFSTNGQAGPPSDMQIMSQYPNPTALKNACAEGKLDCSQLSPTIKNFMNSAH